MYYCINQSKWAGANFIIITSWFPSPPTVLWVRQYWKGGLLGIGWQARTQWCIYQLLHKYFNPTVLQKTFTTGQFSNSQLYIYPQNIMVRCLKSVCVWKVIFELGTNTWVCQCQFLWIEATYFLINVRNQKMYKLI